LHISRVPAYFTAPGRDALPPLGCQTLLSTMM
jgi:hypothetical protein